MLKFFSCRLNKFFPGSFGRKRIGSGTLWNFSWPAATRNSKIGFPRQFFLPYEPVKNFSHGKKKFSHWQKRKINEQSTIYKQLKKVGSYKVSRYTTLQHLEKFAKNSGLGSVSELSYFF